MTTLREAATMALEAMQSFQTTFTLYEGEFADEIAALRAALAEPESHRDGFWCKDLTCRKCYSADFRLKHTAPLNLNDPAVQKRLAAQWGYVKEQISTKSEAQVNRTCPKCSHPMFCAVRCDKCGRAFEDEAEPVATMTVREDLGVDFKFSHAHTLQPGQQFYLYTATPQRKPPLTDDQLDDIAVVARRGNLYDLRIAIERAHGIGGQDE